MFGQFLVRQGPDPEGHVCRRRVFSGVVVRGPRVPRVWWCATLRWLAGGRSRCGRAACRPARQCPLRRHGRGGAGREGGAVASRRAVREGLGPAVARRAHGTGGRSAGPQPPSAGRIGTPPSGGRLRRDTGSGRRCASSGRPRRLGRSSGPTRLAAGCGRCVPARACGSGPTTVSLPGSARRGRSTRWDGRRTARP